MEAIETSKTHKLYLLLKERITSGALRPGDRLLSEPKLAAAHGISRVTIRRALDGLARDGLINRQPGSGTYVNGWAIRAPVVADLSNMLSHLVAMGRATRVKLLSFGYAVPAVPVIASLRLRPGERAQSSVRVRYLDEVPFSHLTTHVPERIGVTYTESDLASTPLLELLERSGVIADRAEQMITATLAGPETAQALQVEIGSALISLTRVVRSADGRGVEQLSALYRADLYAFQMEMVRSGDAADRYWNPMLKRTPKRTAAQKTRAPPAAGPKRRQPSTARR